MQEVKRDHLNLAQIAKSQNIPYCKLYHVYLMLGSISEAVKVCRKSREYLENYKQYLREYKKKPKEPKPLSEIAKECETKTKLLKVTTRSNEWNVSINER